MVEVEQSESKWASKWVGEWWWRTVEFADGTSITPKISLRSRKHVPHIRFTQNVDNMIRFEDSSKVHISARFGCNLFSGEWIVHTDQHAEPGLGRKTMMLCNDMEAEELWSNISQKVRRYILTHDELRLLTDEGDALVLERERPMSPENRIDTQIVEDRG